MADGPGSRKRRDNISDAVGSTLHTAEPLPPFPGVVDDLIYICYRADPEAIAPLLPPGLHPDADGNVIVTFFREDVAWGFPATKGGFFSPVIREYPGPDTQEACCFVAGVATEPFQRLFSRHFAPFRPGGTEIRIEGRRIWGRMWDDHYGDIARIELEIREGPPHHMTANDRYLGVDGAGHLVSTIAAVIGRAHVCDLVEFEITEAAPPIIQALRPITHIHQTLSVNIACTWGIPERIWQAESNVTAGRAALLDVLDRQARAVALVSATGHVLHANSNAARLLATLDLGHAGPIIPFAGTERRRFLAALERACAGRLGAGQHRFALPRRSGGWPLIAEMAQADPALAGPGTALVMLTDPMGGATTQDPSVLQLLGLTPAEARIAAFVGGGLSPREAALRLGLQENTVRSTLKLIYEKLGVRRQSELAQIVARL